MAEDFVRSLIREGDRTAPAPLGHGGRAASTLGAWAAARQTWMLNTQADLDYYVEAHPSPEKPMLDARAGAASLPAAALEGGTQSHLPLVARARKGLNIVDMYLLMGWVDLGGIQGPPARPPVNGPPAH